MTASNAHEKWLLGRGPIQHQEETVERVVALVARLVADGRVVSEDAAYALLAAADRLTCTATNVVAHMTYARRIDLSGAPLEAADFKPTPEGHTGSSLNMVQAYVGYLLANALTGSTRGWIMGQGHCVAAIEAVNALTGDVSPAQQGRYDRSEAGLSQLCADFYSYAIDASGQPAVPLGSHAGPNTAGAVSEGGYLGFAELQYVHMPLPGESLVAFLSDGAFEEQRGPDWAPRWWRAQDCGFAIPVMILNGRRIEQRTQIVQEGGAPWLAEDVRHNGFAPVVVDGRDPAAIAWAIVEAEDRLRDFAADPDRRYPAPLPYVIAETEKGFGFPGAGTNAAHNLPLGGNPHSDATAREAFNMSASALYVPPLELDLSMAMLSNHAQQRRPRESGHPMASRHPEAPVLPVPKWEPRGGAGSAMTALDRWFVTLVEANPGLRVLLTHTRPEPMLGVLRRLDNGPSRTRALGYLSRGGTLDVRIPAGAAAGIHRPWRSAGVESAARTHRSRSRWACHRAAARAGVLAVSLSNASALPPLRAMRLHLLTQHQAVAILHVDCHVCHSEGLASRSQVLVTAGDRQIQVLLYQTDVPMIGRPAAVSACANTRRNVLRLGFCPRRRGHHPGRG